MRFGAGVPGTSRRQFVKHALNITAVGAQAAFLNEMTYRDALFRASASLYTIHAQRKVMPMYACVFFPVLRVFFARNFQAQGGRSDRRARTYGATDPTNCERGGVLSAGIRRAVGRCDRLAGDSPFCGFSCVCKASKSMAGRTCWGEHAKACLRSDGPTHVYVGRIRYVNQLLINDVFVYGGRPFSLPQNGTPEYNMCVGGQTRQSTGS